MATSGVKLKVGITFLLAFAILLAGILWLKEYHPAARTAEVRVLFDNAGGIAAGDPVNVAGIKVGVVKDVSLTPENRALVRLSINKAANLRADAVFRVRDIGVMGDKALVIDPGTARGALDTAAVQKGAAGAGIDDLIADAEQVLAGLKNITAEADSGLDIARLAGSFEETMVKVRQLTAVYKSIAEDNRTALERTLNNVEATSTDIRRFIDSNNTTVAQAIESFRRTSDRLSELVDSLRPFATVGDTLAASLTTGTGTFARFIRSGDLHEELRHTNAAIDSFITDFRENPGKYTRDMKFKVRLF